uniref:isoleucine--tRNA ligase n=1 Tax=Timema cristinae TaxID=61476 RepID=A0A7R9H6H8_TIMCR|nr:unnamed protein product [Timema cristinae]
MRVSSGLMEISGPSRTMPLENEPSTNIQEQSYSGSSRKVERSKKPTCERVCAVRSCSTVHSSAHLLAKTSGSTPRDTAQLAAILGHRHDTWGRQNVQMVAPSCPRPTRGIQTVLCHPMTCGFSSLYAWQRKNVTGPDFVLHDGPPYANGKPHMGHAINKILKDITLRHKLLQGHKVHYVPGWDCHGLPIELKVLQGDLAKQATLTAIDVRKKARDVAVEAIDEQQSVFRCWGILADWDDCYYTFDTKYIKNQLWQFYHMFQLGLIFRDMKPVFWSPSSRTALAEAELEYNTSHRSTAVTTRLRLTRLPEPLGTRTSEEVFALVWTTTPWTLPLTQAICFNPHLQYSLCTLDSSGCTYIVASELVDSLHGKLNKAITTLATFPGSCLKEASYQHPCCPGVELPFLPGDHVNVTKGTGLAHCAPAHGPDDFLTALKHNLAVECRVDRDGCFTDKAPGSLRGLPVLTKGTEAVLQLLSGDILHVEDYVHSYPYDWRTKQPVIWRASHQWFIDTDRIKQTAMERLKEVLFHPKYSGNSMSGGGLVSQLERRPYWCISRQRVWGVPIPVLYHKVDGRGIINRSLLEQVCSLMDTHGTDAWWSLPVEQIVSEEWLLEQKVTAQELEKGQDILDIWFDSGISWSCVLEDKVADLYLEGIDQFTGWFQSSLLTSVALKDRAPYRQDHNDKGRKMSKSVGNVVDPVDIVQGGKNLHKQPALGIDTLRWWVSSHATQHATVPVSQSTLQDSTDAVHKLRLVLKFLLGALHDYPPLTTREPESGDSFTPLDQYMLHLLWKLNQKVVEMYENYQYNKVCATLVNFVTNHVSAFYCHIIKDRFEEILKLNVNTLDALTPLSPVILIEEYSKRVSFIARSFRLFNILLTYIMRLYYWGYVFDIVLYCAHESDPRRRDCQTVLFYILETLTGAFAPVLPHLAEEIYLYHPHYTGTVCNFQFTDTIKYICFIGMQTSVFRGGVVTPSPHWNRAHLIQQMNIVLELRRQINKVAPTPNTWELDAVVFSQGNVSTTLQVLPTISIKSAMVH